MSEDRLPCRDSIDFLDQYLEDSLTIELRTRFEAHLDDCPYCRDYLQTFRETIRMTASLGPAADEVPCPLPDELIRAVRETLEQSE